MDPKDEARQRVQSYLYTNKKRLEVLDVDAIVSNVRLFVVGNYLLLDGELRAIVSIWRSLNGPIYPLTTPPQPSIADSQLVQNVKKAFTTVIEGVDITAGDGKVNISVTGLTAELKKGDSRLAAGVSWGGTLGLEAQAGSFHFSGEISSEHWELKFSYPEDTAIPDLGRVTKVFGEGETAMREIISATSSFRNLHDVTRIKDAVKPHMQGVKDAVEAVKGIAKAKPRSVNFGFSIGSPPPMPGQTGIPPGIQGTVTLTVVF